MERPRIINRRTALYLMAAAGSAAGSLVLAEGVAAIDKAMKPRYVLRGNPAPPMDEKPPWQRPTDWIRMETRPNR